MGAFVRILSRYLIGGLAVYIPMSNGIVGELLGSEDAMKYVDGGIVLVATAIVEYARRLAKIKGWSL